MRWINKPFESTRIVICFLLFSLTLPNHDKLSRLETRWLEFANKNLIIHLI